MRAFPFELSEPQSGGILRAGSPSLSHNAHLPLEAPFDCYHLQAASDFQRKLVGREEGLSLYSRHVGSYLCACGPRHCFSSWRLGQHTLDAHPCAWYAVCLVMFAALVDKISKCLREKRLSSAPPERQKPSLGWSSWGSLTP